MVGGTGTSTSTGKIVRVLTSPDTAGSTGVTVKATEDDPRYEVPKLSSLDPVVYSG